MSFVGPRTIEEGKVRHYGEGGTFARAARVSLSVSRSTKRLLTLRGVGGGGKNGPDVDASAVQRWSAFEEDMLAGARRAGRREKTVMLLATPCAVSFQSVQERVLRHVLFL